jgi:hypothetical protein
MLWPSPGGRTILWVNAFLRNLTSGSQDNRRARVAFKKYGAGFSRSISKIFSGWVDFHSHFQRFFPKWVVPTPPTHYAHLPWNRRGQWEDHQVIISFVSSMWYPTLQLSTCLLNCYCFTSNNLEKFLEFICAVWSFYFSVMIKMFKCNHGIHCVKYVIKCNLLQRQRVIDKREA